MRIELHLRQVFTFESIVDLVRIVASADAWVVMRHSCIVKDTHKRNSEGKR
jgi:hypothetical protein